LQKKDVQKLTEVDIVNLESFRIFFLPVLENSPAIAPGVDLMNRQVGRNLLEIPWNNFYLKIKSDSYKPMFKI
jgi:hypothetical protein